MMNHSIHKQVFDIHVSSKQDAIEWQDKISDAVRGLAFARLEKVFDELSNPEEIIRIDKLELDLGKINASNFVQMLDEQAALKFKESIVKQFVDQLVFDTEYDVEEGIQVSGISDNKTTSSKSDLDAFVYFFRNGVLPWWFSAEHKYLNEIWNQYILKTDVIYWQNINHDLQHTSQIHRMISITEESNRMTLLMKLINLKFEINDFDYLINRELSKNYFSKVKVIIQSFCRSVREKKEACLLAFYALIHCLINAQASFNERNQLLRIANDVSAIHPEYESFVPFALELLQHEAGFRMINALQQSAEGLAKAIETMSKQDVFPGNDRDLVAAESEQHDAIIQNISEDHSIPVPNAGIVLLWPYLQMFFIELGFVEGKEFVDAKAQERAVQILHFIVSNQEFGEEWEWPLLKLMCGLQLHDFVDSQFELSDKEKQESENLLKSVIRNWSVLKNTSPATLQASFLRREGLIKKEQDGWIVHIERTGIDVLLDKITWPISVIRLPWNDYMIHVQW